MDGGIHLWRWKESAAVLLQLVLEFFFLLGTSSLNAGRKKHTWESETKSSEPDSGEQNKLSPCLSVYLALRMPLFHSLFLWFFSPHLLTRDSERTPAALNLISSLHKSCSVSVNQIFFMVCILCRTNNEIFVFPGDIPTCSLYSLSWTWDKLSHQSKVDE